MKKRVVAFLMAAVLLLGAFPFPAVAEAEGFTPSLFRIITKKTSTIAPGVTQEIIETKRTDGKGQNMYYITTADLSRDDVHVYANFADNQWENFKLQKITEQLAAAKVNHSTPGTDRYIPYYEPVAIFNADFYNMSTGQPNGAFAMEGHIVQRANGSFFAVRKNGTAVIGRNASDWDAFHAESPIQEAVGGAAVLIWDGVIQSKGTASIEPRTMVGITADGKVVLGLLDGRQSPFSYGGDMYDIAEMMLAAGCVRAINLDGGGSSGYAARQEGASEVTVVNRPSDGYERDVSTSLMIVSTTPPSDTFIRASLSVDNDYLAPGASMPVSAVGLTSSAAVVDIPESVQWQVDDSALGRVTQGGVFTANAVGDVKVQMVYQGAVVGETTIHVVEPDELACSLNTIVVPYGEKVDFTVRAMYQTDYEVTVPDGAISLALSEPAQGTLNGYSFTASSDTSAPSKGTLTISCRAVKTEVPITLGRASEVLFDFESDALDSVPADFRWGPNKDHTQYNIKTPHAGVVDRATGRVHSGEHALALQADWSNITDKGGCTTIQLDYKGAEKIDMSETVGIGAWVWIPDEYKETNIRFLTTTGAGAGVTSTNLNRKRESTFEEGCWVYLYQKLNVGSTGAYKASGAFIQFELYASATCDPAIKSAAKPFTFYIDDITVDYSPAVPDREAPVFGAVTLRRADGDTAMTKGSVIQSTVGRMSFSAAVQDDMTKENYTGIDPASAVVTVDGIDVGASYKNGTLFSQEVSLAAGVHTVRMAVSDGAGNERSVIRQVNVTANTNIPTVKVVPHDSALNNLPLGSVYYVDVVATDVEAVQAVDLKLDLNDISTWELDHATVDSFFEMTHSVQDWHMGDNIATIRLNRKETGETDTRTGEAVLASLPIRVWSGDAKWTSSSVGQWPRDVSVEVDLGKITYAAGYEQETLHGFSAARIQTDTEINAWGNAVANSKWHMHTAKSLEAGVATCTEGGYEGRTFCEGCNSPVEWGTIVPAKGHAWASYCMMHPHEGNVTGMHCGFCGKLLTGEYTNPQYGTKAYYKDGMAYTGWLNGKYYNNGTQQADEFQTIDGKLYRFEGGVCEGQTPYTGEYDGKGYQDGVLHTGWLDNDSYYVEGVKQTDEFQEIEGKLYQFTDGVCKGQTPYTGFYEQDSARYYYELGEVQTGSSDDGWFQAGEETCHACEGKDGALGTVTFRDTRTCTQNGFKLFTCETCGKTKTSEGLWAEGHKWDKESTSKNDPPMCTKCHTVGKYLGDVKIEFAGSPYFICTGGEIRAAHTVTDGDKVLSIASDRQGADGLASYQNNVKPGVATLHIEGRGDYYGTVEANFYIIPANVPAVRVTEQDKTSVTLAWDAAHGAGYYGVYWKNAADEDTSKNWHLAKTTAGTELQVTGLTFGETYQFRVAGRATVQGEKDPYTSLEWTKSEEVTLAHLWGEEVIREATCTQEGSTTRTCKHCGEEETATMPMVPHTVETWAITKSPTDTEDGAETGHCSVCNRDVTRRVPSLKQYTITSTSAGDGTLDVEASAREGVEVTITATPAEDYDLDKLTVTYVSDEETVTIPVEDGKFTMPAAEVTITATFKRTTFNITVSETQNGTVAAPEKAKAGQTVTVTATPAEGYELDQIAITYEGSLVRSATQVLDGNTFTMPESDVTVSAVFTRIAHKITVEQPKNGSVSVAPKAPAGETVTVTATPDSGYALDQIKVTYQENGETKVVSLSGDSFTMPDADVTVTVTFKRVSTGGSTGGPSGGGSTGGSSGSGSTPSKPDKPSTPEIPVNTETSTQGGTSDAQGGSTTTETIAAPAATVTKGTASVEVDEAVGEEIVKQAVSNKSDSVVIAPTVEGNVSSAEVSIPAQTVEQIEQKTSADLTVSTPVADVKIPNTGLADLSVQKNENIAVSVEKTNEGVELIIKSGDKVIDTISSGVTIAVPVEKASSGTVAMIVREDGSKEIVPKSVAVDGNIHVPLDGSAKVVFVDNSKEFKDVKEDNWAADAVSFASSRELFQGTGKNEFSPEKPMTRNMLVTVLYRLEQGEADSGTSSFKDVPNNQWYSDAVSWAAKEGIVAGYSDGTFGGNDSISREQLAVMLYRYCGSPKVSGVLDFLDASEASDWARDALIWAQKNKVMLGSGGKVRPRDGASRAEVAQLIMNYVNYLAGK